MYYSKYLSFLFLLALAASCASPKPVSVRKVESFSLKEFTGSSATLAVNLRINNPNDFKIKIKEYDLTALINNQDIGRVNVEDEVVLKAQSEDVYQLNLKPDMKAIFKTAPKLMFADSATFNLKGNIRAKVFLFSKSFPINLKHKVAVKDLINKKLF